MSFFYRVFTPTGKKVWADEIEAFLNESELGLGLCGVVDEEEAEDLDAVPFELALLDEAGQIVATLGYDDVETSDFLADEIEEFQGCVEEMFPECNREWVSEQLDAATGCYCFVIEKPGFIDENWDRISALAGWIREETGGIEQSDGGQITNENGDVVLIVPDEDELVDADLDDEVVPDDDDDDEEVEGAGTESEAGAEAENADGEDYDEEYDFDAALRVGDEWVLVNVDSDEAFDQFLRGEA